MESLKAVHARTRRAYNLAAEKYQELFHNEMAAKAYDRKLLDAFALRFARGARLCDAGCGPSAQIGRYLFDKEMDVVGIDISDRCVEMAAASNAGMRFKREDLANMSFDREALDGLIAYYSIIHTPKMFMARIFREFHRVLKPEGSLLVAVKAGADEGYLDEIVGISAQIYFAFFQEQEIARYFERAGFVLDFLERRDPYDFEIKSERIFAIGRKTSRSTRRSS